MALPRALPLVAAAAFLLATVPAAAHPESAAPSLRPDVVAAWHSPAAVPPHTQWRGHLQLTPESNVTAAAFQVCRVGLACFAPPSPAQPIGNGTWAFDTTEYTVNGRPVDYGSNWRLGIKWWLTEARAEGNTTVEFPQGPDLASPDCEGPAAYSCAEAHYLAFHVEAEEHVDAPSGAAWAFAGLLLAVALVAGRRPD